MKTYTYVVADETCHIYYPETPEDLADFEAFLARGDAVLAFDTETTDLDIFKPSHRLRLAQFGNGHEAWVLRADLFHDVIADTLRSDRRFTIHNMSFDLLVVDHHLGVTVEELGPKCFDTRIFSHLMDPRSKHEGGIGNGLKELSEVYIDPLAPDTQKGLYEVFRKEYKATKDTGWALIDADHPTYVTYAGLDVILGHRLFYRLAEFIKGADLDNLSQFEHELAQYLCIMQRRGLLIDVPYTTTLKDRLADEAVEWRQVAARYGVENVNSTKQVSEALVAMGERLTETTDTGALKVDKGVLLPLADMDNFWETIGSRKANPLANAVLRAKRAERWSGSYADAFLTLRDHDNRIHPFIGGLQARTARMSVSRPPLQQLPSSDWTIRRAIIADPGDLIIASDYDQVEMRVLAALAEDPVLIEAIKSGVDLHDFTAAKVFGKDFTKRHRKIAKAIGFGTVYGGGAATIARQTGETPASVKPAIEAYHRTYRGIRRFGNRLQRQAQYGAREVLTVSGRHLPLDRDRAYAATNYAVQSTSRDVLAEAIMDLFDKGLGEYLLMPIHDEILGQAPADIAEDVAREIGEVMSRDFYGVPLTSSGEVYGPSWGAGYGAPE